MGDRLRHLALKLPLPGAPRIRELGLEVRHEEFDDDHRNVGYRYEVSMPALAGVLDEE